MGTFLTGFCLPNSSGAISLYSSMPPGALSPGEFGPLMMYLVPCSLRSIIWQWNNLWPCQGAFINNWKFFNCCFAIDEGRIFWHVHVLDYKI